MLAEQLKALKPLDALGPSTDALYALSGNGTATALPTGALYIEITAVGSDLWFRVGKDNLGNVAAPSAALANGAPRYLPQGGSIVVDTREATRYAIAAAGSYGLAWWTA